MATPNAKRLKENVALQSKYKDDTSLRFGTSLRGSMRNALKDDGYGTIRSKGATAAADRVPTNPLRASKSSDAKMKARSEAASEERRESRGMAAGGKVKRGYGAARCK